MKIIVGGNLTDWMLTRIGNFDLLMAFVCGLKRLGHETYLMGNVELKHCRDADGRPVSFQQWEGKQRFETLTRYYGVWPHCCLIYNGGEATHGMSFSEAITVAKAEAVLLNNSGKFANPEILQNVRCKVFIDGDPAQTQAEQQEGQIDHGLDRHHYFFTVGLNVGKAGCDIPTCNRPWRPFVYPVFLPHWPARISEQCRRFTTISKWSTSHRFTLNGRHSGQKSDSWLTFIELPKKTRQELEIALRIDPSWANDIKAFRDNGWILSDPRQLRTLEDLRNYCGNSRAEFSVAKHFYVEFHTGWFGDRSARYLASGKPVLVQSTGIEDHLPVGKGLLTFKTMDEAVAGIESINKDYLAHCRAARAIAEEHFDSDKVLSRMLKQCDL
jgi:hypothetical protein